jgi:hypothetical protein
MRKITKRLAAAGVAAGLVLSGTAAYAYWTGGGDGQGAAQAATQAAMQNVDVLQIGQDGLLPQDKGLYGVALVPGGSVTLATKLHNNNTFGVKVGTLTASIAPDQANGVNPADFRISYLPDAQDSSRTSGILVDRVIRSSNHTAGWEILTPGKVVVTMLDTDANQDAVKGATVKIQYHLTAAAS